MLIKKTASLFLFSLIILFSAIAVNAQGTIIPQPCGRCPQPPRPAPLPRALPIKSIKIDTKISGQVATTHVEQIFRNDTDAIMEGTYLFPIPDGASIAEFAIWDAGKRYVGEVRSREEARKIYDEIVRKQRDPGLLEYAGKDLFQASIFPIPARGDKKLEITYTQVLKAESNVVSYRYPLGTGKNLNVIEQVAGRVEIEGKEVIRNIYSPSHAIDNSASSHASNKAVVTFETNRRQEPQDFQLFYSVSKDDFGLSLLAYREAGKDGYFLLLLSPKDTVSEQEIVAKDVVFVIDTSGSMADEGKMEKARAALLFGVKSLRDNDRYNVISFAGEERLMETGLIKADSSGRKKGEDFVKALRPTGSTNINDSLVAAFKQFDNSDRPKMLVFMTDGLPTVSETKIPRIMDNVKKASKEGIRLFTFGVGYDVNTELLDKLAADNSGVSDYVEPKEDLEIKVSNFFSKVNYPVLTDIALNMGEVQTDLMYPRKVTDLFKGSQIALIGRYRNSSDLQNVRLRLTGKNGIESRSFSYENLAFPLRETKNDFLPRLWATRRVGWLVEQIRTNGETKELRDEVTDLGTRFGIVTPYTSYLALESGQPRDERLVTVTGGTAADSSGGRRPARNAPAPSSGSADDAKMRVENKTGSIAVSESKRQRAQQEANRADKETDSTFARNVRSRTFYARGGVWEDSEFKSESKLPETTVEFGSDAYFELIRKEPELAEYFSLGEEVVAVYKGRVYRVVAKK